MGIRLIRGPEVSKVFFIFALRIYNKQGLFKFCLHKNTEYLEISCNPNFGWCSWGHIIIRLFYQEKLLC